MPHTAVLRTRGRALMVMAAPTTRWSPTTRSTPCWSASTSRTMATKVRRAGVATYRSDRGELLTEEDMEAIFGDDITGYECLLETPVYGVSDSM
jgi:hypothetical protein